MAPPKIYTDEYIEREAEALEEWLKKPGSLYFCDFVLERDYGPEEISRFAKVNARFAQARARAKMMQERKLMDGGLTRKYDSSFCMFTMKNVCLWNDKTTVVNETVTSAIAPEATNTSRDPVNDRNFFSKQPSVET